MHFCRGLFRSPVHGTALLGTKRLARLRVFRVLTVVFLAGLMLNGAPARGDSITRSVTIGWDAPPGVGVVGYSLQYGTRSRVYSHLIDAGNRTSAELPNLVDGTTYFITVTAYTVDGKESGPSEEFVHTPNPAMFLNISARATVGKGDGAVIAGFIVGGSSRKTVVARALGPSLAQAGIDKALADPTLELHGPEGVLLDNDNWREGNPAAVEAIQLAPPDDREAAIVATLTPGTYTVVMRSKTARRGIGLIEVYDGGIPAP